MYFAPSIRKDTWCRGTRLTRGRATSLWRFESNAHDSSHVLPGALVKHQLEPNSVIICGHELLTIIIRYALILVSTLDPASAIFALGSEQKLCLRLAPRYASKVVCLLHEKSLE